MATDWTQVTAAILAVGLIAAVGYYALQRLRARRLQRVADITSSPVFADDRAFNQIRMARGEVELLRREGQAVPRAELLLDQAEAALRRRDNVDAVRMARSAHDLLVQARAAPAPRSPSNGSTGPVPPHGAPAEPPTDGRPNEAGPTAEAPGTGGRSDRPPKNRMEAHFQMTLLVEELHAGGAPDRPGYAPAEALRGQAQTAYAAQEYTEALRLTLRARRQLGTLGTTVPTGPAATPVLTAKGSAGPSPASPTPGMSDERCVQCGAVYRTGDRFCRGCGATRAGSACPRCGAPISPQDGFCGRCGNPRN